ncbi:MAG TPA: FtsW/RodA/SpoVE family cell cycle protein [Candidatus Paceibacterota bacterium]
MRIKNVFIYKPFFITFLVILGLGFLVFLSSLFSVLSESKQLFFEILISQVAMGLIGGALVGWVLFYIPPRFYEKVAYPLFIFAVVLSLLVFIPGLGVYHGGAHRWLNLGFTTFQPGELLKVAAILAFAKFFSTRVPRIHHKKHAEEEVSEKSSWKEMFLPLATMLCVLAGIFLGQRDTDNLVVISSALIIMYFVWGAPLKHFGALLIGGIASLGALVLARPYVLARFKTFWSPEIDPLGASYQVRQSLIAIGSGGLWGKGYGMSIQKFSYLPEPLGDSIFAVIGEEFGFIGTILLITLFILFLYFGMRQLRFIHGNFERLVIIGVICGIVMQAFLNIGGVIQIFPMAGNALPFVSQGGTALFLHIASIGMILGLVSHNARGKI